jgi:hypothetical protein
LAKAGAASGLIATTAFQEVALRQLAARGVTGLPLLIVEHPLGGEQPEAIVRRAQQAFEQLVGLVGRR